MAAFVSVRCVPHSRADSPCSPYRATDSCTNEMLSAFFSDAGTVRYAFVVTAQGQTECTGEGFVQYATGMRNLLFPHTHIHTQKRTSLNMCRSPEAECKLALEKLQGAKLLDRKLKLSYAQRRQRSQAVLDVHPTEVRACWFFCV